MSQRVPLKKQEFTLKHTTTNTTTNTTTASSMLINEENLLDKEEEVLNNLAPINTATLSIEKDTGLIFFM